MRIREINLASFGPVIRGKIPLKDVNVFFGPNNSGKSMTARLVYGVSSPESRYPEYARRYRQMRLRYLEGYRGPALRKPDERVAWNVMRAVNDEVEQIVTRGSKICTSIVETDLGRLRMTLKKERVSELPGRKYSLSYSMPKRFVKWYLKGHERPGRAAIYIPAARTGTIQFFSTILYMRNELLRDIIRSFGGSLAQEVSPAELRRFLLSLGRFPLYLEDFYDLLLRFLATGPVSPLETEARILHYGKFRLERTRELPSLAYVDSSGFQTEIEKAGSGVVASFPILLGMTTVGPGGVLIVEEPEVHLEPFRQMVLLKLLCEEAIRRKVMLVLTTHSDFVVKKMLGLVTNGTMKNSQVSLHYFEREPRRFTRVRSLPISRTGEAEQPLFDEAVDALTHDYSGMVSGR
jgi:predicted ATPase